MIHRLWVGVRQQIPVLGLGAIVVSAAWVLCHTPVAGAVATPSKVCHAAMIIDRSSSVGSTGVQTISNQIRRLFQPTGIHNKNIELAFWTFADVGGGNFNAPFYGYVSSFGNNAGFDTALNSIVTNPGTNYQQAFGYQGNTRNAALNDIINSANILVFMTDGQPNAPGFGSQPKDAGRQAAQKHQDAGRTVIGGSIGANTDQKKLINYVVTGDENNAANTFTVSGDYGDLAKQLTDRIGKKCIELFPPTPCQYNANLSADDPLCKAPQPTYGLAPSATADSTVISSDDSAGFHYRVVNSSPTTTSQPTNWSIKQVVVDKDQSTDPLNFGSDPYRDNYSCAALLNLIGNRGICNDVASGTRQFVPGSSTLADTEVASASHLTIDDKWPVGTKVCYVFTMPKPSDLATPTDRYGRAACVVIGKRPSVQILGGDVNVGQRFVDDSEPVNPAATSIQAGQTIKGDPINRVFGSWAEYGIFATGPVVGLGSNSGLENGAPVVTSISGGTQDSWNKLTFANAVQDYGSFTSPGTIPDEPAALLASNQVVSQITIDPVAFNGAMTSGIYEKNAGDLTISTGTLDGGSSVIVSVPNGTVTIDGDLMYNDGPYTSITEIPRLVIIAKNINIKGNVARVDAWLVARNSPGGTTGGGGIIDTCSDGPHPPADPGLTINDCANPLMVNGPVMARHLLLRRTAGSGIGASSGDPAETIDLRADTYLSALAHRSSALTPATTYTVELPPRF